jgi:hypothetical protein
VADSLFCLLEAGDTTPSIQLRRKIESRRGRLRLVYSYSYFHLCVSLCLLGCFKVLELSCTGNKHTHLAPSRREDARCPCSRMWKRFVVKDAKTGHNRILSTLFSRDAQDKKTISHTTLIVVQPSHLIIPRPSMPTARIRARIRQFHARIRALLSTLKKRQSMLPLLHKPA